VPETVSIPENKSQKYRRGWAQTHDLALQPSALATRPPWIDKLELLLERRDMPQAKIKTLLTAGEAAMGAMAGMYGQAKKSEVLHIRWQQMIVLPICICDSTSSLRRNMMLYELCIIIIIIITNEEVRKSEKCQWNVLPMVMEKKLNLFGHVCEKVPELVGLLRFLQVA